MPNKSYMWYESWAFFLKPVWCNYVVNDRSDECCGALRPARHIEYSLLSCDTTFGKMFMLFFFRFVCFHPPQRHCHYIVRPLFTPIDQMWNEAVKKKFVVAWHLFPSINSYHCHKRVRNSRARIYTVTTSKTHAFYFICFVLFCFPTHLNSKTLNICHSLMEFPLALASHVPHK